MKIIKAGLAALLVPGLVCLSMAEDRPAVEKSAEPGPLVHATPKVTSRDAASSGNSEVFENLVIAAGKTITLNSALDYSASDSVAVSVLCIICSTAATSLGNSGLVLQARWTVADAGDYVTTENRPATTFPYSDAGGAVFNVFGPQFRLVLQNKGTQTIALQQVTIFHRSK
uniref:Uncharacterized protein n=1 Tax=Solibacter usitatus (strain Ellin6076) TaxID=234267 RepID=Q02BS7_SOLUE